MKKYNISQAAKIAGVARSTIYNDIRRGILRTETDTRGQKCIDHHELLRLYKNAGVGTTESGSVHQDEAHWAAEIRLLKQENRYLETLLEESREREREARQWYERMFELVQQQSKLLAESQPGPLPRKGGLLRRLRS
jgi:hypothetical protein